MGCGLLPMVTTLRYIFYINSFDEALVAWSMVVLLLLFVVVVVVVVVDFRF